MTFHKWEISNSLIAKDAVSNKTLNTTTAILQTSLCQYVDNMHRVWPSVSVLVYRPGSYFSTIPYPKPNLTLHELRDPDMPLYSVERTVFKTLCKGNSGLTVYSELGPRPYYDALLPAICHQIPGCTVLRSVTCIFANIILHRCRQVNSYRLSIVLCRV